MWSTLDEEDWEGEGAANAGDANIKASRNALKIGISLNLEEERFTIFDFKYRWGNIKTLGVSNDDDSAVKTMAVIRPQIS